MNNERPAGFILPALVVLPCRTGQTGKPVVRRTLCSLGIDPCPEARDHPGVNCPGSDMNLQLFENAKELPLSLDIPAVLSSPSSGPPIK